VTVDPSKRLTWRMREVAELAGVSLGTVKNWTSSGRLVSVRIGGVVLVKPEDLEAHREGNRIAPVRRAGRAR
jgi:excisionase family DNA binding protein